MDLAFCLIVSWFVVNLCVIKGVKSSGKVVYFTATFPYVVLLILLVNGLTLPGAIQGVKFLFVPDWAKLGNLSVWLAAAGQVFFSLGISWGGIIMFGSYNRFHDRVHIDAHVVSIADFLTSLIASIVIFSTLGHTAHELGVPIQAVAKGGQGLAFVAYPEALAQLPAPHFWCFLFFSMLFLLGLDSEFALFETVLVTIYDAFPHLRKSKTEVTTCLSILFFLLGLPCITQKGQYVLDLMDTYGASFSVMIIAIFEMMIIMWVYGVKRFCDDIRAMLGFYPSIYFKFCWAVTCPLLLLGIIIASIYNWKKPSYGPIPYPDWAHGIGWILAIISIIQIPLWFFIISTIKFCRGKGFTSSLEAEESWLKRRNQSPTKDYVNPMNRSTVKGMNFKSIFGKKTSDETGMNDSQISNKSSKSFMSIGGGKRKEEQMITENEKKAPKTPIVPEMHLQPATPINQEEIIYDVPAVRNLVPSTSIDPHPAPPTSVDLHTAPPTEKDTAPPFKDGLPPPPLEMEADLPPPPPTPPQN
eukprot:TRINITY_DN10790_c0_g1_i1.p1 TRINITY_DN10790_c0_g1~~TRINITY_DN10790_c0_g1_i1.p1  ORF type:complete len:615 (-),score=33.84 TRINITY_DN10790_c0_g1_i1:508-2088(-)